MGTKAKSVARTKTVKPPARDPAPLVHQDGTWWCDLCGKGNPGPEPRCRQCVRGDRPDLLPAHRRLLDLLAPTGAFDTLRRLASAPRPDAVLVSLLESRLPKDGYGEAEEGPVAWCFGNGKKTPAIRMWFDRLSAPVNNSPPPDLTDRELVELLREAFKIPSDDVAGALDLRDDEPAETPPPAGASGEPDVRNIPVELIDRFPLNPRDELEFDEASLRELGGELKQRQVQACVVRPSKGGDRFELIAGERRYRAAKLCRLPTLRCEVVKVDTATAVWMCGQENERRKDWSAIAKARWYRELKNAESLTDEQLAKRIGVSQGQVTSTMGLLDLPDDWQRRVISQEMSSTAVRPLIPWAKKRPQVLDQVATELRLPGSKAKAPRSGEEAITVRDVEEAVRSSLTKCTRSMAKDGFDRDRPLFSITKPLREALDVESLKILSWTGPVLRAWNVAEWDRLQREAKKRRAEKGEPETKATSNHRPAPEQFREWTLRTALLDWQAARCLEHLKTAPAAVKMRFTLLALASPGCYRLYEEFSGNGRQGTFWKALQATPDEALIEELFKTALKVAEDEGHEELELDREDWHGVGESLGIRWADAFEPTKEMLEAWPLADLKKFPNAPKDAADKAVAIDGLLANWKRGFIPKQVRKLLGLKAGKGDV